ncbi:hypothetical protein E6P09_16400 (plasmid) [Haloferax mediterranei ATCC 33500]|uniref:DUF7344 domain-containing protein n=1 Tax=Haloferax mediterranei (strain ATCC 33500 / DSM 1411 / JCM 8866 / NBRC 14739 / NCIMB 2177 / R-4) TaxID=523841 RepID=I3RB15_HALMT|nr:hypothetical protein [Haloferax mediterranei]AFK21425.1 hypothetical protein HFX_6303 [Haloferax mediterranei ATCC 33500]AHZ24505.1 hypothetical protein BM92_16480 [Haloferax mediterranei ATCC 33500]ELZ97257.1 hypothetical protein C439_18083 [Haloferax mediterranei ATCC 33500]MDX5990441.1 hypothetical protein [Haloferax mediterranei ATCC 33500]QCQ76903.1 hypothetical protein E6P09_16400 [Haloferax mediterranei ATCC 33500]
MVTDSLQTDTEVVDQTPQEQLEEITGGVREVSEQSETEALSKDVVFEILKNQRRRDALRFLKANDGEAKLGDMAEFIAAKENDIEIKALSSSQRKRVYIGLYQCHLPKMDSSGIVDFDKNRGDITLLETAKQLDQYLDGDIVTMQEQSDQSAGLISSSKRNLTIAAGVAATVSAGLLGIPGLEQVPTAGWAVLSTATLMAITAMESYKDKLHV